MLVASIFPYVHIVEWSCYGICLLYPCSLVFLLRSVVTAIRKDLSLSMMYEFVIHGTTTHICIVVADAKWIDFLSWMSIFVMCYKFG